MQLVRRCLLLHILLLFSSPWGCNGVLGPDDYGSISGGQREARCPHQCYCSGQSVECTHWNGVDPSLFPRSTTALYIKDFPDRILNTTLFGYVPEIQWLRLSPGRLEVFPDVTQLTKLSFLDLSENRIETLSSKSMGKLEHLMHLNLSSNRISTINEDFLHGLDSLTVLDLSNNPLPELLPNNLFYSNSKLNYLDLSDVGLSQLPKTLLEMPNLYYLNLSYNALTSTPILEYPVIDVLDVSHNPLTNLPGINKMHKLKKLFATDTSIRNLVDSTFQSCNHLTLLDIRASNLTNLDGSPLRNCRNLEELKFSRSPNLWRIEEEFFEGLENLRKLHLDDCPSLYELERDIMNQVKNLNQLHLQNSGLEVLPRSLQNLVNLTLLNIKGTKLRCNCNAFWLPEWLQRVNGTEWEGVNPITCKDNKERTREDLSRYLEILDCTEVEVISPTNEWILAPWGQSALLDCNATGSPSPNIIWQTSQHQLLVHSKIESEEWTGHQLKAALSVAKTANNGKYQVLQSGKLLIKSVRREDIGRYKCFAYNSISNASSVVFLGLQDKQFRAFIHESLLFGVLCAAVFLFVTLLMQFIKYVMDRLGCQCCCCKDRLSPKAKQIRQMLESVETYKSAQLDKLKENYNSQVAYIKDSCYQQVERLRESYAQQSKNLRDLRDYSTQQISGARDQYVDQVNKVRDYSLGQMNKVRENYVFQRQRIRKFSAHQLLKLRETYKYQQKTLNKILETLPDFYIQNCRTGSCQRTDSILFDELDGLDVYYKVDFLDNISTSDYYTPSSTLTRHKGTKCHTRTLSTTSAGTEYHEANSWIVRQESIKSDSLKPIRAKLHERSFSLAMPPTAIHRSDIPKGHKRSYSASHPSPQFHPKPALVEEPGSPPSTKSSPPISPQRSITSHSRSGTPLYTPMPSPVSLTPEHKKSVSLEAVSEDQSSIMKSPSDECTLSEVLSVSNNCINVTAGTIEYNCDNQVSNLENSSDKEEAASTTNSSVSYETSL